MSLHPGMKVRTYTGKKATIVAVEGNSVKIRRNGSEYYVFAHHLTVR
jgi:hypothetical protein